MRRLKDDRGAVAVIVALAMVPLLVCTALVIDMGAGYVRKRQLQNAADAAVLAVAQNCASPTGCGDINATATTFTTPNVPGSAASAVPVVNTGAGTATVTTSSVVNFSFAPVIGVDQQNVTATATAAWGSPTGGTAVLPLTLSWCSFNLQLKDSTGLPTGTSRSTIYLTKSAKALSCTGQSGNAVPGGFGWLVANTGCTATASLANVAYSDPGNSVPQACQTSDFASRIGQSILLPLFDSSAGTGQNATYHLYAYAGFHLTGYNFGGQFTAYSSPDTKPPCNGSDRCVQGYFTGFVDVSGSFTYGTGTPDLGARIVSLTN